VKSPLSNYLQKLGQLDSEIELPSSKSESYRYTNLALIAKNFDFERSTAKLPEGSPNTILISNGEIVALPDPALFEGVTIRVLPSILKNDSENNPIWDIASRECRNKVHIEVRGHIKTPLTICYIPSRSKQHSFCELSLELKEDSSLNLLQDFLYDDGIIETDDLTINLHKKAILNHTLFSQTRKTIHFGKTSIEAKENSCYNLTKVICATKLFRDELNAKLCKGSLFQNNLITVGKSESHCDLVYNITHQEPHGQSNQMVRNILDDKSRASFQGNITIEQGSSETNATLLCRNTLMSTSAKAYTKPTLDIKNSDVKCSHGATTGTIDETMLTYLLSRGIKKDRAIFLLIQSHLKEMICQIGASSHKQIIQERLFDFFGFVPLTKKGNSDMNDDGPCSLSQGLYR